MSLGALLLLCASALPSGEWRHDVRYGRVGGETLLLDAIVPPGDGPHPAVIVVHGGGYVRGDKQTYVTPLFAPLTEAGFAVFTINYRLAPKHRYPAAVEDVQRAIVWLRKHAAEYRVDPQRLGLIGDSAGGHLTSLIGARTSGKTPVKAVVSFYAVSDLAARVERQGKMPDSFTQFFGVTRLDGTTRQLFAQASPVRHVQKGIPPYLLIHGTGDPVVPYEQSTLMCQAIHRVGGVCEVFPVSTAIHGMEDWEPHPELHGYKEKLVQWLTQHL